MQGEIITNKIIEDARDEAKNILKNARHKVKEIENEVVLFEENLKLKMIDKAKRKIEIYDKTNQVNYKIISSKSMLQTKNDVIDELEKQACEEILKLTKKQKLSFVENILKEKANKNDTVFINIKGLTLKDVSSLPISKKLSLKFVKGEKMGIMISNEIFDDCYFLEDMVKSSFRDNSNEIIKLLFGN